MNALVSILVPARNEEGTLPVTLPTVLAAAERLPCPAEVIVIAPGSSPVHARPPLVHPLLRWATTHELGKFEALRGGVACARGETLVLVDADVIVAPDSFIHLVQPLLANTADVVAGRIDLLPCGLTASQRLLERWALLSMIAWDLLRSEHPQFLWALPGAIYGMRRDLWPTSLMAPLVDDASVGLHAWEAGARFTYASNASIRTPAPARYRHWISQKLRSRRGWATLAQLRPAEVSQLQVSLRTALTQCTRGEPTAWLMQAQDHLLRAAARASPTLNPSSSGKWNPQRADSQWTAPALNSQDQADTRIANRNLELPEETRNVTRHDN
jgi:hypothetical protein